MRSTLVIWCLALLFVSEVHAEEKAWQCFVAVSLIDKWSVEECTATVSMTTSTFESKLFVSGELRHTIVGTRNGKTITARFSTEESDLVDYPLSGKYEKIIWKGQEASSIGREVITLSKGGIVVGFVREINN